MLDQTNSCEKENILRQLLKVQAQIKVSPIVRHGKPKVYCIDSCLKPCSYRCDRERDLCNFDCCDLDHYCDCCDFDPDCDCCSGSDCCGSDDQCNYTLTQIICVEIPISFDADVDIKEGILCCGKPAVLPDLRPDIKCSLNNSDQIYILMKRQF